MANEPEEPLEGDGQDWMEHADHHPGVLHRLAAEEGALTDKGTIKRSWLNEKSKEHDTTGQRARLALTFDKYRKGR